MTDTTEVFKKMCERAGLDWNPKFGDNVYCKSTNETGIVRSVYRDHSDKEWVCFSNESEGEGVFEFNAPKDSYVPLWTQGQLQEMAWAKEYHEDNIDHLLMRFYTEIHESPDFDWGYWAGFRTMEQKWLAFVMKSRYNKVWIKDEWKEDK